MTKLEIILYVIILGLVVNLMANMIWKYLPFSEKHLDKYFSIVLIVICILLVVFNKPEKQTAMNQNDNEREDTLAFQKTYKEEMIKTENIKDNDGIIIGKIESQNSPIQIENIKGDKVVINNEQNITDHINLKYSSIDVGIPYGYFMNAIDKNGKKYSVYAQPKSYQIGVPNSHSQDIVLTFDVTNPNKSDIRIIDLYVEVLNYIPVEIIETNPVASAGETRKYFCNIEPEFKKYTCKKLFKHDYIKISYGELEHFGINVNTSTRGIYKIGMVLKYSFNGKEIISEVGQVYRLVGYF